MTCARQAERSEFGHNRKRLNIAPTCARRRLAGCWRKGTGTPALYRCWNHRMSRTCVAFLALTAIFVKPVEAGEPISRLLDRSDLATAYSAESDLVTAYATG